MNTEELYQNVMKEFDSKINFLSDKPEETIESTVKACWFSAAGVPRSTEESIRSTLPDLTESQKNTLYNLLEQRLQSIPLAHLTGRQNFMGIELLSDKRALIPRKETEILGKKALEISLTIKSKNPVRLMDICCGAGNLGLAIAKYNPDVEVFCTDLSKEAIELTEDNISFLGLNDRAYAKAGDLFSAFEENSFYGKADIIVCNPPYISSAKVNKMNTEISNHEPALAFDGGMFGTKIIQRLIMESPKFLIKGGWLLFEVGAGQGDFILRLFENSTEYHQLSSLTDTAGNIRVIVVRKM